MSGSLQISGSIPHACALLACLCAFTVPAQSDGRGPFVEMLGTWQGTGKVVYRDRKVENIACRSVLTGTDVGVNVRLTCTTRKPVLDVEATMYMEKAGILGRWSDSIHRKTGTITGTVRKSSIEVQIGGGIDRASLSLATIRSRQDVHFAPQNSNVEFISITMLTATRK